MTDARRYYEARVALAPLGIAGQRTVEEMEREGLTGVVVLRPVTLGNGTDPTVEVTQLGRSWAEPEAEASLRAVTGDADVVVFVVSDAHDPGDEHIAAVATAARESGDLIAALLVGTSIDDDTGRGLLAQLRDEVDMLVSVRSVRFAASFLDVVRGGRRSGDTTQRNRTG